VQFWHTGGDLALDKSLFTHKTQALQGVMYRVACSMLKTDADRYDAIQQALLQAWEKRNTLRHEAAFDAWLIRILMNVCKSIYRQQARMIPMDTLPETPVSPVDLSVQDAVERLSPKLRVCVLLHYVEDLPTADIAALLRIPASTVRSRLANARKSLRLELTPEEDTP
jgi:RNA polymerase sigma-70 factor (ECF subfamily)